MAKQYPALNDALIDFIARQHIFFTATAAPGARVNISPRPTDCLRILSPNRVAYRDLTGSGHETAAHTRADGRMTIMVCAFEGAPNIVRLYGRGTTHPIGSDECRALLATHFEAVAPLGTRQIVTLDIDLVQTSCGYGVPLFDYRGERENLTRWAEHKGAEGLEAYRQTKNAHSIDGLPTGIGEE